MTAIAVLLTAAGLLAAGCGFFDTRDLVTPVALPDGLVVKDRTVPSNIILNYANAVQFGVVGQNQFEDTMGDEFRMTFDIADSTELLIGSIDKDTILKAYNLAATAEPDSFHFSFEDKDPEEFGNTASYDRIGYTFLILTRVAPDSGLVRETYTGNADIRLATDDFGNWVLTGWDDFNNVSGNPSWGRYIGESALAVSPTSPGVGATLD